MNTSGVSTSELQRRISIQQYRCEVDFYSDMARCASTVGNEFNARRYARLAYVAAKDALALAVEP